jgi:hypothetical protein
MVLQTKKNCETNKKETMLYLWMIVTQETVPVYFKIKDQYMITRFVKPHANIENLINMVKHGTN